MTTEGCELVDRYVEGVLNERRIEDVSNLFAPGFRDNDPLCIPGLLQPDSGTYGTREDVRRLVGLLTAPGVDVRFVCEDVFGYEDRVGFRIFGQGTIPLARSRDLLSQEANSHGSRKWRRLRIAGATTALADDRSVGGYVFDDMGLVEYQSVGIFRVASGRIVERWGVQLIC
jgi:hypothetical protein